MPKLKLPSNLLKIETSIAKNHFNLMQNRLSIVGLTNLDATSNILFTEKYDLLNTALETNAAGLDFLTNINKAKKIIGPTLNAASINNEIVNSFPDLIKKNEEILKRQKGLLNILSEIAEINANVFKYDLEADLGKLHPVQDRDKIIERSSSAILGLKKIRLNLEESFADNTVNEMVSLLQETESLFQDLIKTVESEDVPATGKLFDDIAFKFLEMRRVGISMERAVIQSPEVLELLKDQTNLLLEYEFWLGRLNIAQKELSSEAIKPLLSF